MHLPQEERFFQNTLWVAWFICWTAGCEVGGWRWDRDPVAVFWKKEIIDEKEWGGGLYKPWHYGVIVEKDWGEAPTIPEWQTLPPEKQKGQKIPKVHSRVEESPHNCGMFTTN